MAVYPYYLLQVGPVVSTMAVYPYYLLQVGQVVSTMAVFSALTARIAGLERVHQR